MRLHLLLIASLCALNTYSQNVSFKDSAFKASLLQDSSINTNYDDHIQLTEAKKVFAISLVDKGISDLTGIEEFTGLEVLRCEYNSIDSIDLSLNRALRILLLNNNNLVTLDVSNNIRLERLACQFNQLTKIDVSALTDLTSLFVGYNELDTLDVSSNVHLKTLYFTLNPIEHMDLSYNDSLETIGCGFTKLRSLDVSHCSKLKAINANDANLNYLNLKNGNNLNFEPNGFISKRNPDLNCIVVDDPDWSETHWSSYKDSSSIFASKCTNAIRTVYFGYSIGPNPTTGTVRIRSSHIHRIARIMLYNAEGRLLQVKASHLDQDIKLSEEAGMYYMVLTLDDGSHIPYRVVKY